MFERVTAFLRSIVADESAERPDDLSVATLAVALAVVRADGTVEQSETRALEDLFREHFSLDHAHFLAALNAAEADETGSSDLYRHAAYLRRHLDDTARIELISILWSLVEADGRHTEVEDHLVWRIAEMLGVATAERDLRFSRPKGKDD